MTNNTVYQPTGDAVVIDQGSANVQVENNILWAVTGHDLVVAPDSENGFLSDYNDMVVANGNFIGRWENTDFASRDEWFYKTGQDRHSFSADPQFNNPAGPDGVLGYSTAPVGAATVIDDVVGPNFNVNGSWVVNPGGYGGVALVTPLSKVPRICNLVQWFAPAADELIYVKCWDYAGHPANSGFVVTWDQRFTLTGGPGGSVPPRQTTNVLAARFSNTGQRIDNIVPIDVATNSSIDEVHPDVAEDPNGNFVISYTEVSSATDTNVRAVRFNNIAQVTGKLSVGASTIAD